MANRDETSEIHCVFVETNLETRLVLVVHKYENISDFKERLREEHKQVFPEIGEINITALKIKRQRLLYHCSDSMNVCKAFDGINRNWFMYIDAVRVEKKDQFLAIMAAEENGSILEKKKEFGFDSILEYSYNKDLNLEVVEEKNTRKRKLMKSDARKIVKKPRVDIPSREKVDDILTGAVGKDVEGGENNDISMGEDQLTSDADNQEKLPVVNSDLVDEVKDLQANRTLNDALETEFASWKSKKGSDESHKSSEDVPIEQESEKGEKTADIVMADQENHPAPSLELVDGQITSRDDVNESHEVSKDVQVGVVSEHCVILPNEKLEKDTERSEGSRLAPSAVDNVQTSELVTHPEHQVEVSSVLTTEKKRKRKKSLKDHIDQSSAAVTTTSREIVNETNEVPENIDSVNATSKSCPILEGETLGNPLAEAIQKETEMGEKSVEDVGRDNIETDNLVSHPENHLKANSELTTTPVTEKKKRRKKSSKDIINQSAATATTASKEIVNKVNEVPGKVDRVDATSESFPISQKENLGKENVMDEKINEDVGIGKAIPSSADYNIQTDNLVSNPENQLEVSSGLTTGPATEKKKKLKKSARKILNEREKVTGSIDHVDATSESFPHSRVDKLADTLVDTIQNENEMGDNVDKVGSKETILISVDRIQAGLVSTSHGLVQESKTLDHIEKFTDENTTREHEISKEKVEIDADQAKSVKSTKKKSSRKVKTAAKEDTLVSGAQNVETLKVVDGEEPDNVIRDVLDSLQQNNETEENLDKTAKKSSKSSKKKHSLNIVEPQVVDSLQERNETEEKMDETAKKSSKSSKKKHSLNIVEAQVVDSLQERNDTEEKIDETAKKASKRSKKKHSPDTVEAQVLSAEVNNAAQKEAHPINNLKDTDASDMKKSIEVADNTEVKNPSKQIQKDNADTGDNFGSSQKDITVSGGIKQDQVISGAKSKKEKKSLDLPKERKSKVQPASSDTSQLQSRVKKVDHSDASAKASVNNKKEAVKKSSNSTTVNKSKMKVNTKKETVKKSSNSVTVKKTKTNFFEDADKWHSTDDEEKSETSSNVSTRTPSDSSYGDSSSDDSDVTSMSRKQGNNLSGGTNQFTGSLRDIMRSSKIFKTAKLTASQSQPDDFDDENLALDFVPDSQAY